MEDLVIATNNKGKINDFKVIFPEYNVIGISELISDFDVEETGTTFEENAKLKSCLLYTSPSPRDLSTSRMPSSA